MVTGLPDAIAHRNQVVPVDRSRGGRHRTRRPLRAVVDVAGHTPLGGNGFRGHFQQVELGGDLEQCTFVLRFRVQLLHISDHDARRTALSPSRIDPGTQFGQRRQRQLADAVALAVGRRDEFIAFNCQPALNGLVAVALAEPDEFLEPVPVGHVRPPFVERAGEGPRIAPRCREPDGPPCWFRDATPAFDRSPPGSRRPRCR